jgi:hypothetical protein
LWLLFFGGGVVAACGSSGGAASPGPDGGNAGGDAGAFDAGVYDAAPIPLGDLCSVFTQDLCIYLMQCNSARYRDLAHCEAELDCYGLPQLQMSAANGGVVYNPAQVGMCNARFLADPCGFAFFLFAPDIFKVLKLCPGTITPLRKAGDPCVSDGECTQGLYCQKVAGCPGTCTPFSQVGGACVPPAQCDPSLLCGSSGFVSDASTEVCHPPPKAGDSCKSTGDCGSTVHCPADPSFCAGVVNLWCDATSGTCQPGVGEGAACGPTSDASPLGNAVECASNVWCDQVFVDKPGTCRAVSGVGGPCNDTGCGVGLHCDGYVPLDPGAKLGTCAAPAPAGGACRVPSDCQGNAYCGSGTCGGGLPFGSMCLQDTDCQSNLTCASGKCAHAAYPGDPCDGTNNVCVLSLCRNGTCVDHAKVGQQCTVNTDCATNACYMGTCADTSVCRVP